jgi:high-affinity iron transporter
MRIPRNVLLLVLIGLMLGSSLSRVTRVAAADPSASPSTDAQTVRSGLDGAQNALLAGDTTLATTAMAPVAAASDRLLSLLTADPTAATAARDGLAAATAAIAGGDQVAFAVARATVLTAIFRGSYNETIKAVLAGDAATANAWLLIRDFRPTTKFARPNSDSTLAIQQLQQGELPAETAAQEITADLLDTYQGRLDATLSETQSSARQGFVLTQAGSAAEAAGYWAILAPSYETQRGADARHQADAVFASLVQAAQQNDADAFAAAVSQASSIEAGFRAAPLSQEDQARRGRQLLLYLSLVPVEYGRGVKQGQVLLDLEIQEAQAFVDAAKAAFADLRTVLAEQDPAKTDQSASMLTALDKVIQDAGTKTAVADPGQVKSDVSALSDLLNDLYPNAWSAHSAEADFDVIALILDQIEAAVAGGQYEQAESSRLEAYAIFEAGPEKHLLAFAPSLATRIEQLFWQGTGDTPGLAYSLKSHDSLSTIQGTHRELQKSLAEGAERLGSGRPATAAIVFNAATIVFREGLEAVLILASLMASMIGANRHLKRPLAIGALTALAATAVLFVLARTILLSLGKYGEKLEAIVSLVAIGILLLVMNWFFHKVYWTKWIAKHHNRRRVLVGGAAGQILGLVVLGFTSVFREGAESVLFLQALVLDAGTWVVIEGTLLGLLGVAVVGALVFVLQKKLPHKKMLIVTGAMIATVLVTMVGTTVHVLQIVGWLPINPIGTLQVPFWMGQWFGIFGTWEGALVQAAAMIFVVGSYYVAEHAQERRRSATFRGLSTANSQG